jgi:hypothetical protein
MDAVRGRPKPDAPEIDRLLSRLGQTSSKRIWPSADRDELDRMWRFVRETPEREAPPPVAPGVFGLEAECRTILRQAQRRLAEADRSLSEQRASRDELAQLLQP